MPKKSGRSRHQIKHMLGDAAQWHCEYCGNYVTCSTCESRNRTKPVTPHEYLGTVDHRLPQHAGGTWIRSNLAIACARCNQLKGHLVIEEPITLQSIMEARRKSKEAPRPRVKRAHKHGISRVTLCNALRAARSHEQHWGLPEGTVRVSGCPTTPQTCNRWHLILPAT